MAASEVGGQAGGEPGGEETPATPFDDRAGRRRTGCWSGVASAHVRVSDRRAAVLTCADACRCRCPGGGRAAAGTACAVSGSALGLAMIPVLRSSAMTRSASRSWRRSRRSCGGTRPPVGVAGGSESLMARAARTTSSPGNRCSPAEGQIDSPAAWRASVPVHRWPCLLDGRQHGGRPVARAERSMRAGSRRAPRTTCAVTRDRSESRGVGLR